ncbi:TAXI family TRAP transporter solute-binding subunit [Salsuginibacillus kocurii]|uniref:TAXI family TRAP transporter solute-binding subunit n=1 Tax=Salsuginibacillus kocurii TaxID=427078 RepID=UPI0004766F5D|nr:TAXI family TRAP transporter solute-binding subunit [Salsuginibacillus kocurii]
MRRNTLYPVVAGFLGLSLLTACGDGADEGTDADADTEGEENGEVEEGGDEAAGGDGLDGLDEEGDEDDFHVDVVTASETGLYYPLGASLADFWSNQVDGVSSSSQSSNGSVQNMIFMSDGEADVGFVMGNILEEAYNGEAGFEGEAYEDVRILGGIYPNYNHVVLREGADLDSIADLEGQDFAPGATGSGTEIASQQILDAYDLTFDDMETHFGDFPEATDLMRNNQVDGANINAGIPTSAVSEMISTADGVLTSIDDEQIDAMVGEYDFYIEETIPAGSYEGQEEDVHTTALQNFLVADASLPDDVAYDLVESLWENIEDLHGQHETFEQFEVENFQEGAGDIPLHPGAEEYYEEQGLLD